MKLKLLFTALAGLSLSLAKAATIAGTSFSFATGPAITGGVLLNGAAATAGTVNANVGFFNDGFDVNAAVAANNIAGLLSNFNIVATASVGNTAGSFGENYAGLYDTGQGSLTATAGAPAIGNTLFTFFGVGASLANSSVYGLVQSSSVVAVDTFPPTDYVLSPTGGTVLMGQLTTSTFSAAALGLSNVSAPALNLVTIPEPSAALLGLLGVAGLIRRRR